MKNYKFDIVIGEKKWPACLSVVAGTNGIIALTIRNYSYGQLWMTERYGLRFGQNTPLLYSEDITELRSIVLENFFKGSDYNGWEMIETGYKYSLACPALTYSH